MNFVDDYYDAPGIYINKIDEEHDYVVVYFVNAKGYHP